MKELDDETEVPSTRTSVISINEDINIAKNSTTDVVTLNNITIKDEANTEILTDHNNGGENNKNNTDDRKHFIKLAFAALTTGFLTLSCGMNMGLSGELLPQLQKDPTFEYDDTYGHWIASILPLMMLFGCIVNGLITDSIGRRRTAMLWTLPQLVGWLVIAFSRNTTTMLIGRAFTGFSAGALKSSASIYMGEITEARYRAVTIAVPSFNFRLGSGIVHLLCSFVYWKTAALICVLPSVFFYIFLYCMKESPLWLISHGRIEEAKENFAWFRGRSERAQTELNELLKRQKDKPTVLTIREVRGIVVSRAFLKPLMTAFILNLAVQCSGLNNLNFYNQRILSELFHGEINTTAATVVIDVCRIAVPIVIMVFGKSLPRKIAYLVCCFVSSIMLYALVLCLISSANLLWLSAVFLLISMSLSSAMAPLAVGFVVELFPDRVRGLGSACSGALQHLIMFASISTTVIIMTEYGQAVLWSSFATLLLIPSVILIFILPETNGRTLHEIEDSYCKPKPRSKTGATEEKV